MRGIDGLGNDIAVPTDLEEDYLPTLWLGPEWVSPGLPPLRKQRGREAPQPPVPPPRSRRGHLRGPVTMALIDDPDSLCAYYVNKKRRTLEAKAKRRKELRGHIVTGAVIGAILALTVFFTMPMFAHTWHIITEFWGW